MTTPSNEQSLEGLVERVKRWFGVSKKPPAELPWRAQSPAEWQALEPASLHKGEAVFISRAFDPMTAGSFKPAASPAPLPVTITPNMVERACSTWWGSSWATFGDAKPRNRAKMYAALTAALATLNSK